MPKSADIDPIPASLVELDLAEAARRFGDSFRRTGFAVVEDHGIPEETIAAATRAMQDFFALPEAQKRRYLQPGGAGQRGYTPFGIETAKGAPVHDLKEFWHVARDLPPGHRHAAIMAPNIWPDDSVPGFRPAARALYAALERTGLRILKAIAVHLGRPADFFADPVADGNSILRLLHYPPVQGETPPDAVRAGAHEDINVITLLLGAEEAGLQLLARASEGSPNGGEDGTGEWLSVPAPPGSLVVNVGDMLKRQTGGLLPSTTHRVVNPEPARSHLPRYSMPFFLHYRPDWLITPFETASGAALDMAPIAANDFLLQRLAEIKLA